jgi:hypothetical protein
MVGENAMKTRMRNVMLGALLVILLTAGIGHADLVGYWSFDNAADPGHDDSGNGNNGTVHGAIPASGKVGNALSFDGMDSYVNIPDAPEFDVGSRITMSAFVKLDSLDGWPCQILIYRREIDNYRNQLEFDVRTWPDSDRGKPLGEVVFPGWEGGAVVIGSQVLSVNEWYHLAVVYDGTSLRMYVDGQLSNLVTETVRWTPINGQPIVDSDYPLAIGRSYDGPPSAVDYYYGYYTDNFHGLIDEVGIYNRALSESEIQQLAGTAEPTPEEQIEEILEIAGTLVGVGKGKLNAFINQLEQAQSYIEDGLLCEACLQLKDIYKKCDGQSPPSDTVTGSAAAELAEKIEYLMESLSCPPSPDLGFTDDFVDSWPDTYSLNCIWKKTDWLWENPDSLQPINVNPENVSVSDGKLVLTVPANEYEAGQIESISQDFHYGYYEARIKASETEASKEFGVVNAFFMYSPKGNNNEIDIEFLSKDFIGNTGKVHFVLHPGNYHISRDLPFNPAAGFHNYGFKWSASSVDFFVDRHINQEPVETMSISDGFPVPSQPGKIMLNNWTGNPNWGGGPPSNTATMEVDWVSFTPQGD